MNSSGDRFHIKRVDSDSSDKEIRAVEKVLRSAKIESAQSHRAQPSPRIKRKIDKKGKYLRNILRHTDEIHSGVYQKCSTQQDTETDYCFEEPYTLLS